MCDKDTYNFEYYPGDKQHGTAVRLSFDRNYTSLEEFRNMCRAFAIALGYDRNEVSQVFPDRSCRPECRFRNQNCQQARVSRC